MQLQPHAQCQHAAAQHTSLAETLQANVAGMCLGVHMLVQVQMHEWSRGHAMASGNSASMGM